MYTSRKNKTTTAAERRIMAVTFILSCIGIIAKTGIIGMETNWGVSAGLHDRGSAYSGCPQQFWGVVRLAKDTQPEQKELKQQQNNSEISATSIMNFS
jgi:hypothetical protein